MPSTRLRAAIDERVWFVARGERLHAINIAKHVFSWFGLPSRWPEGWGREKKNKEYEYKLTCTVREKESEKKA